MNIDITSILNGSSKQIDFESKINFDKSVFENTDILKLDDILVSGSIYVDDSNSYHIDADVSGVMVLPCSVTLKEVDYKFSCRIEEVYDENELNNFKNDKNLKNTIDILPIIWENIILEIPLRVVATDAYDKKLEGDGWKLITDQEGEE